MEKWIKAENFPWVRCRKHHTRKKGVKHDQYFTIRYKLHGNRLLEIPYLLGIVSRIDEDVNGKIV